MTFYIDPRGIDPAYLWLHTAALTVPLTILCLCFLGAMFIIASAALSSWEEDRASMKVMAWGSPVGIVAALWLWASTHGSMAWIPSAILFAILVASIVVAELREEMEFPLMRSMLAALVMLTAVTFGNDVNGMHPTLDDFSSHGIALEGGERPGNGGEADLLRLPELIRECPADVVQHGEDGVDRMQELPPEQTPVRFETASGWRVQLAYPAGEDGCLDTSRVQVDATPVAS